MFSRLSVTAEARIQSRASPSEISSGKIGTETEFSSSTAVLLGQYHFTGTASHLTFCHGPYITAAIESAVT